MKKEKNKAFDPDLLDIFLDPKDKIYLRYISDSKTPHHPW